MKFRPKIDEHDYVTKMKHVGRFLGEGNKVKLTIMFRGREMAHPELGLKILRRVAEDLGDIAVVETDARQDGRNMTMVLHPIRKDGKAKESKPSTKPRTTAPAAAPVAAPAATDAAAAAPATEATEPVAAVAVATDEPAANAPDSNGTSDNGAAV